MEMFHQNRYLRSELLGSSFNYLWAEPHRSPHEQQHEELTILPLAITSFPLCSNSAGADRGLAILIAGSVQRKGD